MPKTRLEAEGLFSNMKQLQFRILTELFSSLLNNSVNKLSFTKSTIGFERCNSHAKFPVGFLPVSKRYLFHQYYIKSVDKRNRELLVYAKQSVSKKKNVASTLLVYAYETMQGNTEEVCSGPKFIYASLINPSINQ